MAWTNPRTWGSEKLQSAHLNPHVRDNLNYLKANIGLGTPAELTIVAGEVAKTKGYHSIDTQGDAATDDLDTINGGEDGDIIFIRAENAARTVVVKNGTGNIDCGGDIYLDNTNQLIAIMYDDTLSKWHPLGPCAIERTMIRNTFQYPAPGTDWTPAVTGATLAASMAAKKCWLPLSVFKIGDILMSYKLVGDAVEAAALTLDCKLVRVNKADPITTTDVAGGGIVQVVANGNFDVEATLTNPETIATDKQYILEILGTTGIGDSFIVMGAELLVIRLL